MPASKSKSKGKSQGGKRASRSTNATSKSNENRSARDEPWSHSRLLAAAILGVALAAGWTHLVGRTADDASGGIGGIPDLPPEELLSILRRSDYFEREGDSTRTLVATEDIVPGTVLMEIKRDMMM